MFSDTDSNIYVVQSESGDEHFEVESLSECKPPFTTFHEGDRFDTLEAFTEQLKLYGKLIHCDFWISDSKSLLVYLRRFPDSIKNPKLCLKYKYMKISCVRGGKKFIPKNRLNPRATQKEGCPAGMYVKITSCGQFLEVKKVIDVHSHSLEEPPVVKEAPTAKSKKRSLSRKVVIIPKRERT